MTPALPAAAAAIPTLATARLVLRAPQCADFAAYAAFFASDRAVFEGGPMDAARAWREFAAEVAGWVLHGFGGWSVTDRGTGVWLGAVALNYPAEFPEPELGWTLAPAAEGRGYAFEAATAARAWFYAHTACRTLVSYISPGNVRSIRLAERLGARPDPDAARPEPGDLVYRHPGPEAFA